METKGDPKLEGREEVAMIERILRRFRCSGKNKRERVAGTQGSLGPSNVVSRFPTS